ncbi:MAG TPA: NYN domain-containing protein [Syntrophorhabdaceae bacterium]|nr:NYN domain-containing protein [Syntrophorhabdaceae bacterium]HOL05103.1 NYN domain-containing protein [Syntrophorhabdaceae bacterium]HON84579.1 NYN domain-containing protein [Syntrophorhabdaceae bacterium]HOT41082.1 NYN domain-containing protein [Syntrophorhabdaceae bacterium]HPC66215.1 NYN domain-containing protein [Syntrophorhabdaceae bacterium]
MKPVNLDTVNLEMQRKYLLERLVSYKKQKPNKITVVFDAYKSISLTRQRDNYKGIEVIYTKENETADELIMEWIRKKPSGMVVVTSDRTIIDEAKRYGIAFITPSKMEELIIEYELEEKDYDDEAPRLTKKGNPKKLLKKLI